MTALANGIAHVSFPGGSVFLPARTPYDRETLVDYIHHHVRANGRVQVLVADQRWLAYFGRPDSAPADCTVCRRALAVACYAASSANSTAICPHCAFAGATEPAVVDDDTQRQAS
jgi:hypothetical protein